MVGGYYTPPPIKTVPEGELTYTALAGPVSEVRVWSPADKQFKLETILPIPRGDATTLFADNQIYVVGGVYDRADPENDNNKQIHRYDPRDGLWTKLHDLGFGLASPAAAVTGKQLYIFGGKRLKPQHITNAAFRYDLEVFKWQRLPSLPAPRAGAAAFVVGNHIYLLGGREAEGIGGIQRLALKGYRYDLNGRKWEELRSPLPEGSYFIVYDGASFYLVGDAKTYRGRIVKTRPAS